MINSLSLTFGAHSNSTGAGNQFTIDRITLDSCLIPTCNNNGYVFDNCSCPSGWKNCTNGGGCKQPCEDNPKADPCDCSQCDASQDYVNCGTDGSLQCSIPCKYSNTNQCTCKCLTNYVNVPYGKNLNCYSPCHDKNYSIASDGNCYLQCPIGVIPYQNGSPIYNYTQCAYDDGCNCQTYINQQNYILYDNNKTHNYV